MGILGCGGVLFGETPFYHTEDSLLDIAVLFRLWNFKNI